MNNSANSNPKSGWMEKDGKYIYLRSSWEINYCHYLDFLQSKGEIAKWEYEVFTFWFIGIKRGVVSYLPDFKVTLPNGSIEWHEVKGYMDSKSATKLKRMAKYHPKEKIVLIDRKRYAAIAKWQYSIPNWGKWITVNPNKKSKV